SRGPASARSGVARRRTGWRGASEGLPGCLCCLFDAASRPGGFKGQGKRIAGQRAPGGRAIIPESRARSRKSTGKCRIAQFHLLPRTHRTSCRGITGIGILLISHTHANRPPRGRAASGGLARAVFFAIALAAAWAAPPSLAADEPVTLNFVNADIDAVIKAVAEITGRNFIVDPKVKGTINIVSSRPVPRSLVYPTLLSALRMQGFAAVEGDGGVVKIVPEAEAKQQGGGVISGPVTGSGDRLVTQVITL